MEKEIFNIEVTGLDTLFIESIEPGKKLIVEIDRENRWFVLREEANEAGSYGLLEAEIMD